LKKLAKVRSIWAEPNGPAPAPSSSESSPSYTKYAAFGEPIMSKFSPNSSAPHQAKRTALLVRGELPSASPQRGSAGRDSSDAQRNESGCCRDHGTAQSAAQS